MIVATIRLALLQSPRHPKMGRITLAIWLYVSITGIVVFWMLRPYAVEHFNNIQVHAFMPMSLVSAKIGDT
jgi:putative membrane protein